MIFIISKQAASEFQIFWGTVKPYFSLVILKPELLTRDSDKKNDSLKVITHLLENNISVIRIKNVLLTEEVLKEIYKPHKDTKIIEAILEDISNKEGLAIIVYSPDYEDCTNTLKEEIIGATNPQEAKEGTIRKIFGGSISENVIHCVDSSDEIETLCPILFNESIESLLKSANIWKEIENVSSEQQ